MIFTETKLKGVYVIKTEPVEDDRGFFARIFCQELFQKQGLNSQAVQCNLSYNKKAGTIRGMHYQIAPHQETKLVRCTQGVVYDVCVDLRPESPTFLQWFGIKLTARSRRAVYVPHGCAHGYLSLTDHAMVYYQVSESYDPAFERTLRWNDPAVGIEWPAMDEYIISEKDRNVTNF
jgi:dTDP-4-dehydrorhamnose 3,5-epimerase